MTTPEDKAKEIERALADRKDADEAVNDKLDKAIAAIEALTGSVGDINGRLDAIEGGGKARADAATDDGLPDVEKQRAAMRGIDPNNAQAMKAEQDRLEAAELAKAQLRADSVSSLFGMQAPPPMQGEKAHAYRLRLLKQHQRNSPEFKDVDLQTVADLATFAAIESRIYADSTAASARPDVPAGMLREVQTRDAAGRAISKFYGEPRSWMQQFMGEASLVTRINKE